MFINSEADDVEEETATGSNSTGTRIGSRSSGPTPAVLGAATSAETTSATAQCGMYLNDYLRMGDNNDTWEVLKLQLFLMSQSFFMVNAGVFDAATEAAVRQYQADNAAATLQPWVDAGVVAEMQPTGYVYKTTRHSINNIVCPGSEAMPMLP